MPDWEVRADMMGTCVRLLLADVGGGDDGNDGGLDCDGADSVDDVDSGGGDDDGSCYGGGDTSVCCLLMPRCLPVVICNRLHKNATRAIS